MLTKFRLANGYDRSKNPETGLYRFMTVREAKLLGPGTHVPVKANDGTQRSVKINGAPKTWKTRPTHVRVPIKYGLYEYAYAESYGSSENDPVEPLLVCLD